MKRTSLFLPGILSLLALAAPARGAVLVNTNSLWNYWKGTSEASTVPDTRAWRSNTFNDAGWTAGSAPFWYGDVLPGGTQLSDMQNGYRSVFLRQKFVITNVAEISALRLGAKCDDGFIAWVNGFEVYRYNMPGGEPTILTLASTAAAEPPPFNIYDLTSPAPTNYLALGTNTLAIQLFNSTFDSSDIGFEASLNSVIFDPTPPTVVNQIPAPGALNALTQITVEFSEPVTGVNAGDLLINGAFASAVTGSGTNYAFTFIQPAYGTVNITWDVGHGITDFALPGNPFNPAGPGATWSYTLVDNTPPAVASVSPTAGFTVPSLTAIEVLFTEPVSGVNATDLLINGVPAASVNVVTPSQYLFQFPQPAVGTVQVAWTNSHGIQDLATVPNAFPGGGWSYLLDTNVSATLVVISEFMAENDNGIRDEDNEIEDWIEVFNAGSLTVNLGTWFLTDNEDNLTKWQFPSTNLPPNGYLLVWASEKNRRVAGAPLHTNFRLNGGGEYLALVRSNQVGGVEVVWEFRPEYPDQEPNLSYGVAMNVGPYSTLIPTGAAARVFIPSSDIGLGWTAPGFNDLAWTAATTGVGFDTGTNYDSGIASDLEAQMLNINPSAFIRVPFNVTDPAAIQDLRLRLRYDDGFVAYLNGIEALRRNAPANPQWNSAATALHGSGSGAGGTLQADFDTVTNAYTASQQGAAPAPAINAGGTAGNFLRLNNDGINSQINSIAFTQTAPGLWELITASFDFRMASVGEPADGFAFMLIPTSTYGASGIGVNPIGAVEEPNYSGVFSVGFDMYPHATQNDVSVHWNAAEMQNTTIPLGTLNMVSSTFHRCNVTIRHADGGAYVTVVITPNVHSSPGTPQTAINNLFIPGLNPFDCRVQFGGRTGGADMNVDLDNIAVQFGFPSGLVAVEEFNVSSSINALTAGANVLAIHGLNRTVSDPDFLITPELVGRSVLIQTNGLNFYATPTPGAANEGGGAGLAGEVIFSVPGGVYTNASVAVALSTTTPGGIVRYTVDGSVPTITSTAYSTPINVANSTVIKARVFAPGLLAGRIAVQTYTMLDANMFTFTSNLPLVIIDSFGTAIAAENKVPCSMVFIDTFRGRSSIRGTPDAQVRAGIELRGSSSLSFPKNSMGFETRDENTNDAAVAILGMPAESDWVLYAPYTDKTFMNDFLTYELWDAMGHYGVRHKFVEVFRDTSGGRLNYNDYWGIYVLLEKIKIDNDRVDIPALNAGDNTEPDISGGYIFKRDRFDGNEHTFVTPNGTGFAGTTLGVEDPKGAQITQAQKNWLNTWFAQMAAALGGASWTNPVTGYAAYIDVATFIDHYWMVEMPKNIDGYRLSNFYHKDRNGRLKEGPIWDWNLSFGNANYATGGQTNSYYWPQTTGDFPWYARLFSDPDFNQRHIDRWWQLRTNIFATSNLLARINTITNLLNEAQARDFLRWPRLGTYIWPNPNGGADHVNYQTPNTYGGIMVEMKRWVEGRVAWIDSGFTRPPVLSLPAGPVTPGTPLSITAASGTIWYTLNGTDPRGVGGNPAPGALTYSGPLNITTNVGVFARARVGLTVNSWSGPTRGTFIIETPRLLVTEIMYHPDPEPPGGTNDDDSFEYVEIKNDGPAPINLLRSRLSGGVDVTLPDYLLHPGCYVVVVANSNAFRARYGNIPAIVGVFANDRLQNSGERIALAGPVGEPIHDFDYDDGWVDLTDGQGFSLVPVNESTPLANWGLPGNWRASAAYRGSPGTNDAAPPALPLVVISEALTHTDLPQIDAVELHNLTGSPADISDWYLSDASGTPKKFRFPPATVIPGHSHLVVYETNFNAGPDAFSLSSTGDEIWLTSGDSAGNLTGYQHGFDYGPQFSGVTFGRYLTSQGNDHFVAQLTATLGSANTGPRVGPVVISEIHYHPPDTTNIYGSWDVTEYEYIELRNVTDSPVPLYHPTNNTLVWRLRDAVEYSFPPATVLDPDAYILVVGFDPADTAALNAFRAANGVPNGIPIYGPWSGKLDNSSESVELVRPDDFDPATYEVPYVLADKVRYDHLDPWPPAADGLGFSLQRIVESSYGNDVTNWMATVKSPGFAFTPGQGPGITAHPQNTIAIAGNTAMLSITATGAPPVTYQWYFNNSTPVGGATNSTLVLPNAQPAQSGLYRCLALNAEGAAFSSNATLTVVVAATINQQPSNAFVRLAPDPAHTNAANRAVSFSVAASSANGALSYQWRLYGTNLPSGHPDFIGVNNATLIVTNIGFPHVGWYSVAVTDPVATVYSADAALGISPYLLHVSPPLTIAARSDISMNVAIQAWPPPFLYSWRRASAVNTNLISNEGTNFATWNSVHTGYTNPPGSLSNIFALRVVFTNLATSAGGLALVNQTFYITVLADTDQDGVPDLVENGLGLNPSNNADGLLDLDGDGASNGEEYGAGTILNDSNSVLRITQTTVPGQAILHFGAISNRTYTIQYTDALPDLPQAGLPWQRLTDVMTRATNRVETFPDPNWTTNRYYRVVTPRAP